MPWLETDPVTERKRFIMEWQSGELGVAELCRRHGISRKTGYKWITRYEREGPGGLEDRSRRPHDCPWAADPELIDEAVRLRYSRRQRLGVRKIRPRLIAMYPDRDVPSERTLHNHFVRRGLVKKRRRSRRRPHPGRPTAPFDEPNSIWSADFKGQFKTLDGLYCYPLTIQDGCSRYLLGCQGLVGTRFVETKQVFRRLFHEYGLPERIRTDNGVPFASMALGRLSRLSVWWIKLGILPDLIEPASPQQNGRHERMHKTLKADCTIPPAGNRSAQQRRFNEFRTYFNEVRPHESLDDQTPASVYEPSPRPMPSKLQAPDYPAHYEVRKVSTNGGIRWHSAWVNVSHLLGGEYIGLEEIAPDVWAVHFGAVSLGWLHTKKGAILDHDGSSSRNPKR
jgi:putative transposase